VEATQTFFRGGEQQRPYYQGINPNEINSLQFWHLRILAAQGARNKIPAGALTLQHGMAQSHLFQHCC
jgi:hypothetical protein